MVLIGTIAVLFGVDHFIGTEAAFWLALGGLISALIGLWEAGRDSEIREHAVRKWIMENSDGK